MCPASLHAVQRVVMVYYSNLQTSAIELRYYTSRVRGPY